MKWKLESGWGVNLSTVTIVVVTGSADGLPEEHHSCCPNLKWHLRNVGATHHRSLPPPTHFCSAPASGRTVQEKQIENNTA